MNYIMKSSSKNLEDQTEFFLPIKYWIIICFFVSISIIVNQFPYNETIGRLFQIALMGGAFLIFKQRPVMMIVLNIIFTIMPSRIFGIGILHQNIEFYSVNSSISIIFSICFLLRELIFNKQKVKILLATYILISLIMISYLFAISKVSYTINVLWLCVIYIIFPIFIKDDTDVLLVMVSYIVNVVVFCVLLLPFLVRSDVLYRNLLSSDPNYISLFLLIGNALILCTISQYRLSKKLTIFLWISFALSAATIAFFQSRTAILTLLILVFLFLLFNFKQFRVFVISIFFILVLYYFFNMYGITEIALERFYEVDMNTAGRRLIIQKELLNSFWDWNFLRQLIGYGYLTASNFGLGAQAHNSYLSILIGFGLIGLFLYLIYLFNLCRKLLKSDYRVFIILLVFLILYGFSLEPYIIFESAIMFSLLMGVSKFQKMESNN